VNIQITRQQIWHRRGRFAWTWVYTVHGPNNEKFTGPRLAWAKRLAKQKYPGANVTLAWEGGAL
jgi:hypothetical protein